MRRSALKRGTTPLKRSGFVKDNLYAFTSKGPLKPKARKRTALKKRSKKKMSKDKVWKEFSIRIRTRGADSEGFNVCVTCGVKKFWRELQAGHFIAGRLNSNLFDERGCHPQCYGCNVGRNGNGVMYYRWMRDHYGEEVINELILQNSQTVKWPKGHLESLFEKYSTLNKTNPLVESESP